MKALVKSKPEKGIWLTDVPEPKMGHNDVLIKIKKTAICGTDIHIYNWDAWAQQAVPIPLVTGHEFIGEVVDMGQDEKASSCMIVFRVKDILHVVFVETVVLADDMFAEKIIV
jgi:threonine 3-dehydrogenase